MFATTILKVLVAGVAGVFAEQPGFLDDATPSFAFVEVSAGSLPVDLDASPANRRDWRAFADFVARFGRTFLTEDERRLRYEAFLASLRQVEEHNAQGGQNYTLAINAFADLTEAEWKSRFNYRPIEGLQEETPQQKLLGATVPFSGRDAVDWVALGAVTPVKNQGSCGGCWAFSATGALEGGAQIKSGKLVSLSEQQFIDCNSDSEGCNGGSMASAFNYAGQTTMCTEEAYKYQAVDGHCRKKNGGCKSGLPSSCLTGGEYGVYYTAMRSANEQSLMSAVARQPVSIAIAASSQLFQLYDGGIFDGFCGRSLDHGVLIVGYDRTAGYWKVKNSWGDTWGEQGYFRLATTEAHGGQGICGIYMQPVYPNMSPDCTFKNGGNGSTTLIVIIVAVLVAASLLAAFCMWNKKRIRKVADGQVPFVQDTHAAPMASLQPVQPAPSAPPPGALAN